MAWTNIWVGCCYVAEVNGLVYDGQLKLREPLLNVELSTKRREKTCFQKRRVTSFPGGTHLTSSQIRYEEHPPLFLKCIVLTFHDIPLYSRADMISG